MGYSHWGGPDRYTIFSNGRDSGVCFGKLEMGYSHWGGPDRYTISSNGRDSGEMVVNRVGVSEIVSEIVVK
jgi:hypothetical protein